MNLPEMQKQDSSIDAQSLSNEDAPIFKLIMYIHSMQTFVNMALNKASRENDLSKVKTLGPYAVILGHIVSHASL